MTEPTPHPVPQPAARPEPTACSVPECNTDGNGEPCDRHETEQAHDEGEHTFCGITCETAFPSKQTVSWTNCPHAPERTTRP